MWIQRENTVAVPDSSLSPTPNPVRPATSDGIRQRPGTPDLAGIGKGIVVKGEGTGVHSVYVDGRLEGSIQIPSERVTVGSNGTVVGRTGSVPCITAREIEIIGTVTGDIAASERVEIRAGGSLTGDVTTVRVSIEDGAYFRGGIDIRREEPLTIAVAARFEAVQPI